MLRSPDDIQRFTSDRIVVNFFSSIVGRALHEKGNMRVEGESQVLRCVSCRVGKDKGLFVGVFILFSTFPVFIVKSLRVKKF